MPGGYIFVDGSGVGDIGWSVVRDRDKLAQAGFFFAVVSTNNQGQMIGTPELRTRGFVEKEGMEELFNGAEETIARAIHKNPGDRRKMVKRTEEALGRYLYEETRRRPIVQVIIR
jgi:ribonuclease J